MKSETETIVMDDIALTSASESVAKTLKRWPSAEMLFDEFWRDGEVALMFGETGAGKSVLAVQIANALAAGCGGIEGFRMPTKRRRVAYVDMEMSEMEFSDRYSYRAAKTGIRRGHKFAKNLSIWRPESLDELRRRLSGEVTGQRIEAVVIDAVPAGAEGMRLVRELKRIRNRTGAAILMIAESAAPRRGEAPSESDLKRRRGMCEPADSVVAIAKHPRASDSSYLMQKRSRRGIVWTERNSPVCRVVKTDKGILKLEFDERFKPRPDPTTIRSICRVKEMKDAGVSFRKIGETLAMSATHAQRLYRKWSPTVAQAIAEAEAVAVAAAGTRAAAEAVAVAEEEAAETVAEAVAAATVVDESDSEPEEWEEGEFEKPVWMEIEGDGRGERAIPDQPEHAPRPMDAAQIPFAAGLGRRSIYDLTMELDEYGKEIFVERHDERTGRPMIYYTIDNKGYLRRSEDRGSGREGIMLGRAPYIEVGGWQSDTRSWLKMTGEKWQRFEIGQLNREELLKTGRL